jgi:hypothetical protein
MIGPALSLSLLACGCATTESQSRSAVVLSTQDDWRAARRELEALRSSVPTEPRLETVRVSFRGPVMSFQGRGAIAVAPGRALRMVLLGPAGRTALDVWATASAYRVAVPELGLVERGGVEAPRHLPIALFREWFLAPLGGRLLAAGSSDKGRVYVVRGRTQTIVVSREGANLSLSKHGAGSHESVSWSLRSEKDTHVLPAVGSRVVFRKPEAGIEVSVEIEEIGTEPPAAEAFDEPREEQP